jgi:hypothetical protein
MKLIKFITGKSRLYYTRIVVPNIVDWFEDLYLDFCFRFQRIKDILF